MIHKNARCAHDRQCHHLNPFSQSERRGTHHTSRFLNLVDGQNNSVQIIISRYYPCFSSSPHIPLPLYTKPPQEKRSALLLPPKIDTPESILPRLFPQRSHCRTQRGGGGGGVSGYSAVETSILRLERRRKKFLNLSNGVGKRVGGREEELNGWTG